jgi:hypothetical protein
MKAGTVSVLRDDRLLVSAVWKRPSTSAMVRRTVSVRRRKLTSPTWLESGLSLRRLVPVMAALRGQLNLLTAEAGAAAIVLDAPIAVTTGSDLLDRTAAQVGVTVQKVALGT